MRPAVRARRRGSRSRSDGPAEPRPSAPRPIPLPSWLASQPRSARMTTRPQNRAGPAASAVPRRAPGSPARGGGSPGESRCRGDVPHLADPAKRHAMRLERCCGPVEVGGRDHDVVEREGAVRMVLGRAGGSRGSTTVVGRPSMCIASSRCPRRCQRLMPGWAAPSDEPHAGELDPPSTTVNPSASHRSGGSPSSSAVSVGRTSLSRRRQPPWRGRRSRRASARSAAR